MGTKILPILVIVAVTIYLDLGDVSAIEGTATFYNPLETGLACKERKSFVIAAASDALWDTGKACGRIYTVRCIGDHLHPCQDVGPYTALLVEIADYCPNCRATMNLSEEAFQFLTNSTTYQEMIKIDYSAY